MTNKAISRVLKETSSLIELTGGNPFRSRAFASAARTIERLEEPVGTLLEEGTLTEIRGIGSSLAEQISELLNRGSFTLRDDLLGSLPPGLLDVLDVKGLGAKKVRMLWQVLGIQTLDDLEAAAKTGRIADLEGFGPKSQTSILENLTALRSYRTRRHFADASTEANELRHRFLMSPAVRRATIVGEVRRKLNTISSICFLIELEKGADVSSIEDESGPLVPVETGTGTVHFTGRMPDGLPLQIHIADGRQFGRHNFNLTGSADFQKAWISSHGRPEDAESENEIFVSAGSEYLPPELREDATAVHRAATGDVPTLIEVDDLAGTLHNHTTYSDGAHSLTEMAEAARSMGLSYFGVCDHSQSLRIAHGLSPQEVQRQQEEIRTLNEQFERDGGAPFRIFSGTESDILPDGSLDYDDDVLASFDFIVVSVHTGFNMTESAATDRIIRAIRNPHTSILGHPTGRLLLRREGYSIDHIAILDACAECGVSVELNANPYRLDLDWSWIEAARERGVLISINPDAHSIEQLAYVKWGVAAARKGWLTREGCLNALSLDAFSAWLKDDPENTD